MSKFFLFSRHNRKKHAHVKKQGKVVKFALNFKNVNYIIVGLVILLGTVYIGIVNSTADKGFEVDEMQNKIVELKKDNKTLELEVSSAQSMQNIKRAANDMQLVEITEAEYVSGSSAMALGE